MFPWSKKYTKTQNNEYFFIPENQKSFQNGVPLDITLLSSPPTILCKNENGVQEDEIELIEKYLCWNFIEPNSCVLELGARYGSVSCIINKRISDNTKQVSVEPDSLVWDALERNITDNNCFITLHKGFVSKTNHSLTRFGYATTSTRDATQTSIPSLSIEDLQIKHNLIFDTLVADCEGFLEVFFEEHPFMYSQIHTIIFEADYPQKCNYERIRSNLIKSGFKEIIYGFQNVYKK